MHRFRHGTSGRLQLPRIILKNNVFFNSEPGPLALAMIGGRVCLYFFWPAGCALICNCAAVFTREVRRLENNRSARFPIGSRELLCFAFSAGDGWTIELRGTSEKGTFIREGQREGVREREAGERKRADREKLAFSRLKINMHGSDSETFILPGLISF